MRAAYITADLIGPGTGGGIVTHNELLALRYVAEEVKVAQEVTVLSGRELSPALFRQPDSVFLYDYFALNALTSRRLDLKLAHFYSGTFSQTVRYLRDRGVKVTYTVPAHDRRVTVEEFGRLGMEYPWHHIKDDDLWAIFSRGYREADIVIAPSKLSAEFLVAEGCRDVRVIPHGCELPEMIAPLPGQFQVSFLSQPGPDKGVGYLIQAWALLNYSDCVLNLAGPGTEQLQLYISRIASGGRFALLGFLKDVPSFYKATSVLVASSVCEAFGLTVLEAMAFGRPSIVSEGAGVSELIADGMDGFVVKNRAPQDIAERIDYLKKNPAKLTEMGRKAREKAENYTWPIIQGRYQEVWRQLGQNSPHYSSGLVPKTLWPLAETW